MKNAGRWIALLGLVLAVALFAHDGFEPIARLLLAAGWGLLFAALFHVVPMLVNARAWQVLLVPKAPSGLMTMTVAVWVRESVNGLLPVARVGGELAGYRVLTRSGMSAAPAAASLVVDMAVSLLSQALFCLVAGALLVRLGDAPDLVVQMALGIVVLAVFGVLLAVLQRSGLFARLFRIANRLGAGRWADLGVQGEQIDRAAEAIYGRKRSVAACLLLQLVGWTAGAGEIWLALHFLGHPASFAEAIVLEATVQAIASIAFIVPGALGVQEGGFLLIGAALGIDGPTALALAAARRLRDVVVFFPGLLVWQWVESKRQTGKAESTPSKQPLPPRPRAGPQP